jgi:glutathione S-transferase
VNFAALSLPFFVSCRWRWCCRRATQLKVDVSGFPNVAAHFKRMQERPSVKKLLAYEKEVNEGFAKTA